MWYFIGWSLCSIVFKLCLTVKVVGRRNVPAKGSFVFASNHESYLDPVLLGTSLHRSLNYMAQEGLFERGFLAWALPRIQAFPVRRGEGDLGAIRQALRLLTTGKPLVIFPEGTRSDDGALQNGKPGIGFIVARSGVPVVPAYIEGSREAFPKGAKMLRRSHVSVYIGKPMHFDHYVINKRKPEDKDLYQKISNQIMAEISKLRDICEADSRGRGLALKAGSQA